MRIGCFTILIKNVIMKKIRPKDLEINPSKTDYGVSGRSDETEVGCPATRGDQCGNTKGLTCNATREEGCTTNTLGQNCTTATFNDVCVRTYNCPDTEEVCHKTQSAGILCCAPDSDALQCHVTAACTSLDVCPNTEWCSKNVCECSED